MLPDGHSKYEGMRKLEARGMPHPDWLFVGPKDSLPPVAWVEAPCGWTVRICSKQAYEFGKPSKHRLSYIELRREIASFSKIISNDDILLVYPSWEFDRSGCCSVRFQELTIEAVYGDIAPLLRGKKRPDGRYIFEGPYFVRMIAHEDLPDLMSREELATICGNCRKALTNNEVVLEWTITKEGQLYFHDWAELGQY